MHEIHDWFYEIAGTQPLATLTEEASVVGVIGFIDKFEGGGCYNNGLEVIADWEKNPGTFTTLTFSYKDFWHIVYRNHPGLEEKFVLIASQSLPQLITFFEDSEFKDDEFVIDWLKESLDTESDMHN